MHKSNLGTSLPDYEEPEQEPERSQRDSKQMGFVLVSGAFALLLAVSALYVVVRPLFPA